MFPHTTSYYLAASRALQRRHARAAADSSRDPNHPLSAGDTVISGKVDSDGDDDPVVVAIEQHGREWRHKGSWYHAWRERKRTVTARPFYLVRPSGERVRVEPDQRVFLIDRLDGVEPQDRTNRVRTARLRAGEAVHLVGTLVRGFDPQQGGYRDAGPAWVLRPPRSGRMLISTEALGARFDKRAKLHQKLAFATLVALMFSHLVLFLPHHALATVGQSVDAPITSSRTWRVWHKPRRSSGYWVHHYEVTATDPRADRPPQPFTDEVSARFYDDIQRGGAFSVPFTVAGPYYQAGQQASESAVKLVWFSLGAILFAMVCGIILTTTLPWYERRRIVETGNGMLTSETVKVQ